MRKVLTIVIPTHERHHVLMRALHYYSRIDVSVLIVDSSLTPFKEKLPNNFDYLHLSGSFFGDKIHTALCKVNTPYACFCADDDFLAENGLSKGMQFLESHSDYVSVQGQYINFNSSNLKNNQPMYIECINYKNDSSEIAERLKNCFNAPHIYALHRTVDLKHCLEITIKLSSISIVEMCVPLVSLCIGKHKMLPIFWQARDRRRYSIYNDIEGNDYIFNEENILSTSSPLAVIEDWNAYLQSNEGSQFKANFLSKVSPLISDSLNADELFDSAFDFYIRSHQANADSLLTILQRIKEAMKVLLPEVIVKKIQERNVKKVVKLKTKSGYPWNDDDAMKNWNLMEQSIIKFSNLH